MSNLTNSFDFSMPLEQHLNQSQNPRNFLSDLLLSAAIITMRDSKEKMASNEEKAREMRRLAGWFLFAASFSSDPGTSACEK